MPARPGVIGSQAALAAMLLLLAGCGASTSLLHGQPARRNAPRREAATVSPGVSRSDVRVIRGWADALRAGRVREAAGYFRLPSVFSDGTNAPISLRTRAQVEAVNRALPCGATLLSVTRRGPMLDALFRLGDRAGPGGAGGCGAGTGLTARTDFLIRSGRIADWIRAPDEPGDNRGGTPTPPSPAPPDGQPGPTV